MKQFKETIGRIYFKKVNRLFDDLNQRISRRKNDGLENINWSAQEALARVFLVLVLGNLIVYSLSFPSVLFKSLSAILVCGVLAVCVLLFIENHFTNILIKKYNSAITEWESINESHSDSEKEKLIQSFFKSEYNRELRYGELKRVKKNIYNGVCFRCNSYLFRDRLLSLKFIFYGPLLRDWDKGYLFNKAIRGVFIYSVFTLALASLSIAFVFQNNVSRLMKYYVMRGSSDKIEPQKKLKIADKFFPPRKITESHLVKYKTDGRVDHWTELSKDWILDKYYTLSETTTLSDADLRKKAVDAFSKHYGKKLNNLPTPNTVWKWLNEY